jgi:cyclopropane fatty-acyl-phospholipid synthase-like methyltransferase
MAGPVNLYNSAYGNFQTDILAQLRRRTHAEDFGQSSWVTADEYRRFFRLLELNQDSRVLDIACGSGGPALFLARETSCRVTGVDVNVSGIRAGQAQVATAGLQDRIDLHHLDVSSTLPFADQAFTAIVCMDAVNHLPDRGRLLVDWRRVLADRGRLLFTDPVVVTGLVRKEDLATRSAIGYFEFGPPGVNERLIRDAGFDLLHVEDVTPNEVNVSLRWFEARQGLADELQRLEGAETFAGVQQFLSTVHKLTSEGRLSRFAYLAQRM